MRRAPCRLGLAAASRRRPLLIAAALPVLAAPAAAQAPAPPPSPEAAPAPQEVVVSRADRTDTVAIADLPLTLVKAQRQEQVLVRRALFVSGSVERRRPVVAGVAEGDVALAETCRWSFKSYLQREICFTSMTGMLSCTDPEVTSLTDMAEGQAELADDAAAATCGEAFAQAAAARASLVGDLRARSAELFEADQASKVAPLFRAAGAAIRPPGAAAPAPQRRQAR